MSSASWMLSLAVVITVLMSAVGSVAAVSIATLFASRISLEMATYGLVAEESDLARES